jgi:hypothetical protein
MEESAGFSFGSFLFFLFVELDEDNCVFVLTKSTDAGSYWCVKPNLIKFSE